jgi:hypothetical protein
MPRFVLISEAMDKSTYQHSIFNVSLFSITIKHRGKEDCINKVLRIWWLWDSQMFPVIPILWITKDIMSRGPQVANMECRETTWRTIPFAWMENPLTTTDGHRFADGIHHTRWLPEGRGPCSMRYKSVLWWASFQYLGQLSMSYLRLF